MPTIKNIIIFTAIGVIFIFVFIFFIKNKKSPEEKALVSTSPQGVINTGTAIQNDAVTSEFLTLLLNVKSIKIDDTIFSDAAFNRLSDSSIVLVPDGNEGRSNPFAPIGSDYVKPPVDTPKTAPNVPKAPVAN